MFSFDKAAIIALSRSHVRIIFTEQDGKNVSAPALVLKVSPTFVSMKSTIFILKIKLTFNQNSNEKEQQILMVRPIDLNFDLPLHENNLS